MTTYNNELDELISNSPTLNKIGAPKGNQNARKVEDKPDGGKIEIRKNRESLGGNSRKYWISRLKRDAPDHLERLKSGEYKTVTEAVREAGIKKQPQPKPEQSLIDIEKLELLELEQILHLAESRVKALEKGLTPHKIAKALHERFSREDENIVYALDYNTNNQYFYISLGKKMYNYSKKYADEIEQSSSYDLAKDKSGFPYNDSLPIFGAYTKGEIDIETYSDFLERFSLPRLHRIILPISDASPQKDFLHPRHLSCYEFTDKKPYTNLKQLYLDAVQAFLDKM